MDSNSRFQFYGPLPYPLLQFAFYYGMLHKIVYKRKKIELLRFLGTIKEIIWANFDVPVTSNFVRNRQNEKKLLFGLLLFCRGKAK